MTATRALIYVRLSVDKDGTSAGVERQEAACRKLCAERGYAVVAVLGAADGSALKDARPGFVELLRLARAGAADVVVGWSHDRLSRSVRDTAELLACGLPIVTVIGGTTEATAEGEFRANIVTAAAQFEVRRKVERMQAANAAQRAAGIPPAGPRLPGLERDREHAELIATGWRRVLNGESLATLAREWSAAGVRTIGGRTPGAWDVKRWLSNPRYAGRLPDGSSGVRPGLVDGDLFDAVQRVFTSRTRAPRPGGVMIWALPAVGRCGRCGARVRSARNGKGRWHVYRCLTGDLIRNGDVPDRYVFRVAAARLEQPDAVQLLLPAVDIRVLVTERDALQGRLDALGDLILDGTLTADGVRKRAEPLRERVAELAEQINAAIEQTDSVLLGLPGPGAAEKLARLRPRLLAEVYTLLFEQVVLEPAPHKGARFTDDEPGVAIIWRA